jgi:branched-subunit amino acid permease
MEALRTPVLALVAVLLAGCDVIGGIFQAGAWTGLVLALVVIAVVGVLFSLFRRK